MAIVNFGSGKKISPKEMSAYIMKRRGISRAEFGREYDKYRNRVRNYEIASGRAEARFVTDPATGERSIEVRHVRGEKPLDPLETMYLQERARAKYGADYAPSQMYREIEATPSTSTGAVRRRAAEAAEAAEAGKEPRRVFGKKYEAQQRERILRDFKGLIEKSPDAAKIAEDAKSPAELSRGLREYARELHEKQENLRRKYRRENPDVPYDIDPGTP